MVNFFLTIALSCIKLRSTVRCFIINKEETGANVITIGTHPNVTAFLEIFGCDNYTMRRGKGTIRGA